MKSSSAAIDGWRRDTPGCRGRIHLNNAGAALMPQPVIDALTRHLEREAEIGGYEAAEEAAGGGGGILHLLGPGARGGARAPPVVGKNKGGVFPAPFPV